jgi:hypothetical protein
MTIQTGGADFEILVDGKSRSYRDQMEVALEAAKYLKGQHPGSDVVVRDARDDSKAVIGWDNGVAVVRV